MINLSNTSENTESYEQYLHYIADLDIPIKEKYELLYIVNSILIHFIDQSFGVQTDQITLGSIGEVSSSAPLGRATIESHPENQTAHVQTNGVEAIPTR